MLSMVSGWKRWLLIAVVVLALDGIKSYSVARHSQRDLDGTQVSSMYFIGVWVVNLESQDSDGETVPAKVVVPPALPFPISVDQTRS